MIEPFIFLGPPGTGKTTALLETVDQELAHGVPPDRIGFFTFTRRGVEEAISRASQKFNRPRKDFRFFNTLHAMAFRQLGLSQSEVFTGRRIWEFGKEYNLELRGELSADDGLYTSIYGDDIILFLENYARITCQNLNDVLMHYDFILPDRERALNVIKVMNLYKYKNGLYDFTDMLQRFIAEDSPPYIEVLMVDEAQDLSELQWKMIEVLARSAKRVYIAGDDDQTIFTWAGASERFITMPGEVTLLDQSYRVPVTVQGLANRIIRRVSKRRAKIWNPRQAEGNISIIDNISQLQHNKFNDHSVMMLARTVKLLRRKFVPYCRFNGLLYKYFETPSIKPGFATAIHSWNELQAGKSVPADQLMKMYDLLPSEGHDNVPGIAWGYKSKLNRIADQMNPPAFSLQELRDNYGLLAQGDWDNVFLKIPPEDRTYIKKVLDKGHNITDKPKIHISTIHRVKGGQADKVVLLSDTGKVDQADMSRDEETRIFYTGITRTFEDLIIVQPESKSHYEDLFI